MDLLFLGAFEEISKSLIQIPWYRLYTRPSLFFVPFQKRLIMISGPPMKHGEEKGQGLEIA